MGRAIIQAMEELESTRVWGRISTPTKGPTFVNWNDTMRRINKGSWVRSVILARPVVTGHKDEGPSIEM
eukprot:12892325-Prorocentrum_lima.AAC.1